MPLYYRNVTFNMIDEVLRWAKDNKGEPGKPIPNIDAFGDGEMWDSGMKHLYGMRIEGAVKLPAGSTLFAVRSEEHTSELQSLMRISYAVFCLKKKKNTHKQPNRRPPTTIT